MAITRDGTNLANENFIPVLYAKQAQLALEKKLVAANIINRTYEKQLLNQGDTVNIRLVDNLTMSTYNENSTINWSALPDDQVQLTIDVAKALAFKVGDIDAIQSDIDILKAYSEKGGYAVGDDFDTYIFSLHASAHADNHIGTTGSPLDCGYASSEYSPVKIMAKANRLLSAKNVDTAGRWMVVPPHFIEQLYDESGKALDASAMGSSQSIALNGFYKSFMGFDLYQSNNIATDGTYFACMFGVKEAIAGAQQINKSKMVELENSFTSGIKVLSVYGAKVVRDVALGVAYLSFDIEAAS